MLAVCRRVLVRIEILEVEPFSRSTARAGVDASCEKDFAAPNDGRGPTEPRKVAFPGHIFGVRPAVGRMRLTGRGHLAAGQKAGHIEIGRDGVIQDGAVQNAEQRGDEDRDSSSYRGQHDLASSQDLRRLNPIGRQIARSYPDEFRCDADRCVRGQRYRVPRTRSTTCPLQSEFHPLVAIPRYKSR